MSVKHTESVEKKNVAAGKDTTIQVLIPAQEGPNFALRKFGSLGIAVIKPFVHGFHGQKG